MTSQNSNQSKDQLQLSSVQHIRGFGSDNHATVHPEIMQALSDANINHAPSYGTDELNFFCIQEFKKIFTPQTETFFVFNGTAANVLSLRAMMRSHECAFVSEMSHLNVDECGAPELFAGKLIPLKTENGKIIFSELDRHYIRLGDQHFSQPKVISLTQPTEVGTVYTVEELKKISLWAKKHNMLLHIDGARFSNALSYLNCSASAITCDIEADVLSFGGTKNGLMFGEAVVIFNESLQKDFKFIRKQLMQLPSKTRFIAAQFKAYFSSNNYLKIAQHSHSLALELKNKLDEFNEIKITYPVQSNAVFAMIPKEWVKLLRKKFFFYVWDEFTFECRLMLSWDNTSNDIDLFIEEIRTIKNSI